MIGIEAIGVFIPPKRLSNYDQKERYEMDDNFIKNKLGVEHLSRKEANQQASDLAVSAFENLESKASFSRDEIDCLLVVTQTGDFVMPHTGAIVQNKLGLPETAACYDIALGCSGFAYGLNNIISFMTFNGLKKGVLITSDPVSQVVDENDKDTNALFGDAATATLISTNPNYELIGSLFGTRGQKSLFCEKDGGTIQMNGREIFNFAAREVPKQVNQCLEKNNVAIEEVDLFVLHQANKYIVETLGRRLKLASDKVPYRAYEYGNTTSSSIPLILSEELPSSEADTIVFCGFGVGLSWSTSILKKVK